MGKEAKQVVLKLLNENKFNKTFSPKDSFESYFLFEGIKFSNRLLGIVSGAILFNERDK